MCRGLAGRVRNLTRTRKVEPSTRTRTRSEDSRKVTTKTATTIVLFTGGFLFLLALLDKRSFADPAKYRKMWAVGVTTTGLAFAADVAPDLTGWFALAVLTGAALTQGGVIGGFLNQGTGAQIAGTSTSTKGTTK